MLGVTTPGEYNGYRKTGSEKVFHLIRYYADHLAPLKTALNKLLFYADFYHFKQFGTGISGLPYRAIQWGPVPSQFDYLFKMAEESNIINLKYEVRDGDKEMVIIEPTKVMVFQQDLFTDNELKSMQTVLEKLRKLKTGQLVELSHKEAGWKHNIEGKQLINYTYAFELLAL